MSLDMSVKGLSDPKNKILPSMILLLLKQLEVKPHYRLTCGVYAASDQLYSTCGEQ